MMKRLLYALVFTASCASRSVGVGADPDAAAPSDLAGAELSPPVDLAGCRYDKLKFSGCQNDGSVEFCAPTALAPTLVALVPTLYCSSGGGRAGCNLSPGLLLCSYPTAEPRECVSYRGALTALAEQELCALAAYPEIAEIVPTILE